MARVYRQIEMDIFITEIPHFQRLKFPTFIIYKLEVILFAR